jgi:hypothetical protein
MSIKFILIGFFAFLTFSFLQVSAQSKVGHDPLQKPNTFKHPDNPHYWKNKMPHPNYWQQDVYYNIKADVDERTDIITGSLELTYWNNSPDTLTYVFFHLYQNAFQPCSYLDDLTEHNHVKSTFGHYEAEGLGTTVSNLKSNGNTLKTETDNTVMKVFLDEPIMPGAAKEFSLDFKTYFDEGSMRRRMKYYLVDGEHKHYNGVHWYPRISVYDAKFGWTTDQHLNREFYADFGTFDLELTFASNYVVEATGNLLNRSEVLPDSLREKLDIKNFAKKPWGEKASIIIPYDSTQRKTWKFHAENVHNVAFTADPTYRIGEAEWNGIKCIALVEEGHASGWQKVAQYTADVVELFSNDFGMYGYPKMVVADARDGMEYPMLTLCGGSFPSNKGLIAHEVGHNWFYGMVGNNETYRAALDEGFTQFLTVWAQERLDGPEVPMGKMKKYKAKFKKPDLARNTRAYDSYLYDAINEADAQLNTHSDGFSGALGQGGGYRHVYSKTAVMLYNLQYVLGDTLFQNAMKNYFNEYSYAHPYFEDLRNSFIHYTHTDLNWFFDQWLETTKNIDYSVGKVKHKATEDAKEVYEITFKREGLMQMPIDFTVVTTDGDTSKYYIPNTWFEKETDATILPRWIGWDNNLQPEYTATVKVTSKIRNVYIDPTYRLADVNMLNNSKKVPFVVSFDHKIYNRARWTEYDVKLRPALWWNAYDGLKIGLHFNSGYIAGRHQVSFSVLAPTGNLLQGSPDRFNFADADKKGYDKFNYCFSYDTKLDKYVKKLSAFYYSEYWDGLELYKFGLSQGVLKNSTLTLYAKMFNRPNDNKLNQLLYPGEWQSGKWNTSINLEWDHKYNYPKGSGTINATLRSSALLSDFDYHYLTTTAINHTKLWRFELHSRAFVRAGTGSNQAPESALFLAGANPEELMNQPLTRSIGYVPPTWVGSYGAGTNHFQQGGGLNLRGYAGYYVVEEDGGKTFRAYKGQSGGAVNLELDFDELVKWQPKKLSKYFKLDTYLFGDAGMIVFDTDAGEKVFSNLRMDAGAGLALTVKKFGPLETVKPFTLRFDVPFYLSHAPIGEDNIKFRFVIGVSRAF